MTTAKSGTFPAIIFPSSVVPGLAAVGLTFLIVGCGVGTPGSTMGVSSSAISSVSVTCTSGVVKTTQTLARQSTVLGTGAFSTGVNWSVNTTSGGNATVGSINSSGIYSAPNAVPTPYTVTIGASSTQDPTKSASVQVIISGVIFTASQMISAPTGGTISLPDGSSVTLGAGTLSADAAVTLSKVSVPSTQPANPSIAAIGPALVLNFSTPVSLLSRKGVAASRTGQQPLPSGLLSSGLSYVINTADNVSLSLANSAPFASTRAAGSGVINFIGAIGGFDAAAQQITAMVAGYSLQAASASGVSSIELMAANFVQAKLQTYSSQNSLRLNVVPSNAQSDTWASYPSCPTGKTLLVVHGMNSSVEDTYRTSDSTIQNIQNSGKYDNVVGYDYDWTQAIDTSGAFVASFLNKLAQCPGILLDIEAHSEGVAVTLSALTDIPASTRQMIGHFTAIAGPIMGTPIANAADLAAYFAKQPKTLIASELASAGLAYVLSEPFVHDLQVSTPGDKSKLDLIRQTVSPYSIANAPQVIVAAGDTPGSMQLFADMMFLQGVIYSDGFIPQSSAFAFQDNSGAVPILKVYPLPPFNVNHTELVSDSSLIASVGPQSNTASSPTLALTSLPSCTNNLVCSGLPGTYFSLGGSGLASGDTYNLYAQDETGNVVSTPTSSFVSSNSAVPQNTWQDVPSCAAPPMPRTRVLFAQDVHSLLATNAVTEQVAGSTCIMPNPVPAISSLSPSSLNVSATAQALTIIGAGFLSSSSATFNGIQRPITFKSSTQLTIALTTADLSAAGIYPVVVTNQPPGGGPSDQISLSVTNVPSVTITPASVSVPEGGIQSFAANVSGGGIVDWTVQEGSSGGTIDSAGVYTAPTVTGIFHVVATSTINSSQTSVATINVVANRAFSVLYSFIASGNGLLQSGTQPNTLAQGSDGNFYGTASGGGSYPNYNYSGADCFNYGCGSIFSVGSTGNLTLLHRFAGTDGATPNGPLIQGPDGALYGTTIYGGSSSACGGAACGLVFKVSSTGTYTILHSFNALDGAFPQGGVILARDGNFYGTTYGGGNPSSCPSPTQTSGCGTIFRMDLSGKVTTLYSFSASDGMNPMGNLTQASNGVLYGTTAQGGSNNAGTIFKIDLAGNFTSLHSFAVTDGRSPYSGVIQAADDYLYGTTWAGGASNHGVVFKMSLAGDLKVLTSFATSGSSSFGSEPAAGLIQAGDGFLYGTTKSGGPSNYGTVYRIDLSGNLTIIHSFGGPDGANPYEGLMEGNDGYLFGTTQIGGSGWRASSGSNGGGVIFKLSP